MARIILVHWNQAEWKERADRLVGAGYDVDPTRWTAETTNLRALSEKPPDAFVIDLGRLPSHGRAVAMALRQSSRTRCVPLVFVDGEPEKVARTRALLPDAVFASWRTIRGALRRAIDRPLASPVVPVSTSGYSGTPLPKKLGIKAGSSVTLRGAPGGFKKTLGALPDAVRFQTKASPPGDVVLLFVKSAVELSRGLAMAIKAMSPRGRLWIAWPKQASGVKTDVKESVVRTAGLDAGLVDFKVAAIDATWAGLCFSKRR